jgi:hypothetical protein
MNFYNTTHETGVSRIHCERVAEHQDARVLAFFQSHAGELFTPSEVWVRTGMEAQNIPLTSVRRAITNLTPDEEGKRLSLTPTPLVRTTTKRPGHYGRKEHCWVYPTGKRMVSGGDLLL